VSDSDGLSAVAAEGPTRGLGRIKRDVTTARVLAIIGLALVVVVAVWSVVGIVSLSSQVSALSAKVDSLSARSGAPAAPSPGAPASGDRPAQTPQAGGAVPSAPLIGDVAAPTGADASGAIVIGDPEASTIVEVYADYQCPYCQRWESEIGAALSERALQPGSGIAVLQYNMAFLGESSRQLESPGASARAANAAACVLEFDGIGAFVDFNASAFGAPGGSGQSTRFDTASLLGLASQSGAGDRAFACIEDGRFIPFVAATTQGSFARGVTGTPTVLIDGVPLQDPFGDPRLRTLMGG
jgi:protein-disulfide isomerase